MEEKDLQEVNPLQDPEVAAGESLETESVDNRQQGSVEIPASSDEEALRQELEKQQELAQRHYDLYLRALAEAENTRKRAARDKEEYLKFAALPLVKKLLPILDDLERALQVSGESQDFDGMVRGIAIITENLKNIFAAEGVEAIDALGKEFDPQYHQPLMVEENADYPENTIIEELQTGYIMKGRVIRPSLVKVSQ